jgi:hypothetical protein
MIPERFHPVTTQMFTVGGLSLGRINGFFKGDVEPIVDVEVQGIAAGWTPHMTNVPEDTPCEAKHGHATERAKRCEPQSGPATGTCH